MSEKKGEYKTGKFTLRRYRRKPQEIKAVQWTGRNLKDAKEVAELVGASLISLSGRGAITISVRADIPYLKVNKGDWIIKAGESDPKILAFLNYPFQAIYEPVGEGEEKEDAT